MPSPCGGSAVRAWLSPAALRPRSVSTGSAVSDPWFSVSGRTLLCVLAKVCSWRLGRPGAPGAQSQCLNCSPHSSVFIVVLAPSLPPVCEATLPALMCTLGSFSSSSSDVQNHNEWCPLLELFFHWRIGRLLEAMVDDVVNGHSGVYVSLRARPCCAKNEPAPRDAHLGGSLGIFAFGGLASSRQF